MGVGAIVGYGPLYHILQVVNFHARLQGVLDPCGLVVVSLRQMSGETFFRAQGFLHINLGWGSDPYMQLPDAVVLVL